MSKKALVVVGTFMVLLASCRPMSLADEKSTATPEATATSVPTETPAPTNTPEPTNTSVPTATSTATPNRTATAQARVTATAQAVIAKIDAELKKYDLSTKEGHLGWMHDPVSLKLDTYGEYKHDVDYPDLSVSDFVLQTDITWETTTGLAGCGLLLRAQPDFERGAQYQFAIVRLALEPLWDIEYYKYGQFQENITGRLLSAPILDDKSGGTNHITVIAQGNKITAYANGDRLGSVIDGRLTKGTVAFLAWQESGETTCKFENSWLWVLK